MKRWKWLLLLLVLVGVVYVLYTFRYELGLSKAAGLVTRSEWRVVNRTSDGFQVEMPADPREVEVPAQNESGGVESIKMLIATPGEEITYSIAWADYPPVVRVNGSSPDRILSMARQQLLDRTQTKPVSESPNSQNGLPGREMVAQNAGGGVLDARMMVAGDRLYMLSAAYPSMDARREQEVIRFFNSFKTNGMPSTTTQSAPAPGNSGIPQSLPPAAQGRTRR